VTRTSRKPFPLAAALTTLLPTAIVALMITIGISWVASACAPLTGHADAIFIDGKRWATVKSGNAVTRVVRGVFDSPGQPRVTAPAGPWWSGIAQDTLPTEIAVEQASGWPFPALVWRISIDPLEQPDGLAAEIARTKPDNEGQRVINDFRSADGTFSAEQIIIEADHTMRMDGLVTRFPLAKPVGRLCWGVQWGSAPDRNFEDFRRRAILPLLPLWSGLIIDSAIFAAAILGVNVASRRTVSMLRLARGRCPCCGYNLSGLTGTCPECGKRTR
jgi:hypothetical protein